ncbi:MAG: hypothetical protein FJ298_13445 [Planctomycetes bacterium]|nr:hypothetical protein [Planctomycetota bacterium]
MKYFLSLALIAVALLSVFLWKENPPARTPPSSNSASLSSATQPISAETTKFADSHRESVASTNHEAPPNVPEPTTGTVTVRVVDTSDREIHGLRLQLTREGKKRFTPLHGTSDASGLVTWGNLEPGTYRYGLLEAVGVKFDPPFETPRLSFSSSGDIGSNGPVPMGLSGQFTVTAREDLLFTLLFLGRAAIRGWLPAIVNRSDVLSVEVNLYSKEEISNPIPGKPNVLAYVNHMQAKPDSEGHFLFDPIPPGPKFLLATWELGQVGVSREVYFYSTELVVQPEEERDLGAIVQSSNPGELTLKNRFVLPSGEEPTLDYILRPQSDWRRARQVRHVVSSKGTVVAAPDFHATIFGSWDERVTVYGLPLTRVLVTSSLVSQPQLEEPYELLSRGMLENRAELGTDPVSALMIDFQVDAVMDVTFIAIATSSSDNREMTLHLVANDPKSVPRVRQIALEAPSSGATGKWSNTAQVPMGEYTAYVVPVMGSTTHPPDPYWARMTLRVDHGVDTLQVPLSRGVSIRGKLVNQNNSPTSDLFAQCTLPELTSADGSLDEWLWTSIPEPDGSFVLSGVPAGAKLLVFAGLDMIDVPQVDSDIGLIRCQLE